jgi:RNA-directed DNA polymerase
MKVGNCEITSTFLYANDVHCHHYIPLHLGGSNKFNNLRILHKDVHRLIHQTDKKTIDILIIKLGITRSMLQKINKYRQMCEMEQI